MAVTAQVVLDGECLGLLRQSLPIPNFCLLPDYTNSHHSSYLLARTLVMTFRMTEVLSVILKGSSLSLPQHTLLTVSRAQMCWFVRRSACSSWKAQIQCPSQFTPSRASERSFSTSHTFPKSLFYIIRGMDKRKGRARLPEASSFPAAELAL